MGRIDPPVCVPMCWCDAHTSLYLHLDFAFFVSLGSGVDYPSDRSSWLQRLGLAKSKVGRNSTPGPDKASSFHCPDAVNSAGGEPLLFFLWLHLGILTSLNSYKHWRESGEGRGCDEGDVMCAYLGAVSVKMRAECGRPELSWEQVKMLPWKSWVFVFFWYFSSPSRNSLRTLFFFHTNFHLLTCLNTSLCPSFPDFSALQGQGKSPSQQIMEFEWTVASGCLTPAPWLASMLSSAH